MPVDKVKGLPPSFPATFTKGSKFLGLSVYFSGQMYRSKIGSIDTGTNSFL